MTVSNARVDGAPAAMALADTPAGARTIVRVTLTSPLPPGAATTIDVDFDTKLPRRFGGFGCDGRRCRLMGGFYPMPAAETAAGFGSARGAGARGPRARHAAHARRRSALVVNGEPVHLAAAPRPRSPSRAPTSRTPRSSPIACCGRRRSPSVVTSSATCTAIRARPGSEDQSLPYVREDVTALVLKTVERALQLADPMVCGSAA